jgi:hypothetical protein
MWTPDPSIMLTAEQKAQAWRQAVKAQFEHAIQETVDAASRDRDFRDGVTLASYAASTNPVWQAQALAFIAWRDHIWAYAYAELAKALSGERDIPSVEDFLTELPAIVWPE